MSDMMRRGLLFFLLIVMSQLATASRRVSVGELEQMLNAQRLAHTPDAESAKQLNGLVLTERLSSASLERFISANSPGPEVEQALDLLADTSAFLDPPARELALQKQAADLKTQRSMLSAAVDFVAVTLQHLPDFVVVRSTRSFDNVSANVDQSHKLVATKMHRVDMFDREVTYRNGREVIEAAEKGNARAGTAGLKTWGEFGPILATVLRDALKGRVVWSHWEKGEDGKAIGVFHYSVPKYASHYQLNYCCSFSHPVMDSMTDFRGTPAYHGALSIDAESGAIRRLTVEADITETDLIERASIAVEYGSVEIGGKTYICPVRSLAYSVDHYHPGLFLLAPITRINEVRFVNYHKFGSSSRIVAAGAVDSTNEGSGAGAEGMKAESAEVKDLGESSVVASGSAEAAAGREALSPVRQEVAPVDVAKEQPAAVQSDPVLKTQTENVLVDVVVTGGDGKPVPDLRQEDFAVTEDGAAERIAFFEEHRRGERGGTAGKAGEASSSGSPGAGAQVQIGDAEDSVSVILLDLLNTSQQSQVFVREKLNAFFKKMEPGSRVALFALGKDLRCVQGFTNDASVLSRAFNDKANHIFPQKVGAGWNRDDEMGKEAEIDRQKKLGKSVRDGLEQLAVAKRQKQMEMTLEAMDDLARLLERVPGRKNLLWFAETFPVRLSPVWEQGGGKPGVPGQPAIASGAMIEGSVDKIREVSHRLTVARVAVYPIEAEGVMEEHIFEADLAGPGSAEENLSIRRARADAIPKEEKDTDAMYANKKDAAGRADAISSMEQLAQETGGKAFFNTNALDAAAARAMADGADYYTIGYSPKNKKTDGKYRKIGVTVRGRYVLSYRHGYFADAGAAK